MTKKQYGTVLITGAAQRIGREIAYGLASEGRAVAIHYKNSSVEALKIESDIKKAGGNAYAIQCDLADETAVSSLIAKINIKLPPVTALINNASLFERDDVSDVTKSSWDLHMAINLRAPFILTQSLANGLRKNEKANIINILDQRVENLTPYFISYTLSKSALWTLTKTTASALAPNIRVNAIGPGATLPSIRQSKEQFARQVGSTPLQVQVNMSEIANAVKFILATNSMTGQLITLDSGQHLGWSQPDPMNEPDE